MESCCELSSRIYLTKDGQVDAEKYWAAVDSHLAVVAKMNKLKKRDRQKLLAERRGFDVGSACRCHCHASGCLH